MAAQFEIHLGHGWYMDSNGRLHQRPVLNVPVYELPSEILPFDAEKIGEIFSKIESAMPKENDPASKDKWLKMGVSAANIKLLASLGKVAGVISIYFAILAAFIAAADALGAFTTGPSSIELKLKEAMEEQKAFSRAISEQIVTLELVDLQSKLTGCLNAVRSYINELIAYKPDVEHLKLLLLNLDQVQRDAFEAAKKATNTALWLQPFDTGENNGWIFIRGELFWLPEGSAKPTPVKIFAQGQRRFDYRLAVPFALYAAQAYLTIIRGIMPEYRTTGQFRDNLIDLAKQSSVMATNMREQGLARIEYKRDDFINVYVFLKAPFSRDLIVPSDPVQIIAFTNYTVGAVDLVSYNDAFLRSVPVTLEEVDAVVKDKATIKRGQMEMLWEPTSGEKIFRSASTITFENAEKCAAEANALSQRAYTELLCSSGYLQLVHQACLLSYLSTEPDSSETVEGKISFAREFENEEATIATSSTFIYSKPFTTPARKQTQKFRARAKITTQPLGRRIAIGYRIWLRSLQLEPDGNGVLDPSYTSAYKTKYVKDESESSAEINLGFKRLDINFDPARVKDEILLIESTTPREVIVNEGTREIKVDSFDWYIPVPWVKTLLGRVVSVEGVENAKKKLAELGRTEEMMLPSKVQRLASSIIESGEFDDAGRLSTGEWRSASAILEGQRRNLREETCTVNWALRWEEERLTVSIKGRPEDRNCALYLVVEERLGSSRFLHTAFPLPMNTQLTFVPIDFFEREEEFVGRDISIVGELTHPKEWRDFNGIPAPVTNGLQVGEFVRQFGIRELINGFHQVAPDLVQRVLKNYPGAQFFEVVQ